MYVQVSYLRHKQKGHQQRQHCKTSLSVHCAERHSRPVRNSVQTVTSQTLKQISSHHDRASYHTVRNSSRAFILLTNPIYANATPFAQGNHGEAGSLLQRSLTIRENTLGPEHFTVSVSLHHLACSSCLQVNTSFTMRFYRAKLNSQARIHFIHV